MQRYTIFFIIVNDVHVPNGFSAHHQELENCTHSIGYISSLLAATASLGELELTHVNLCNLWFEYYLSNKRMLFYCTAACCNLLSLISFHQFYVRANFPLIGIN
jgi:hypothetical protein